MTNVSRNMVCRIRVHRYLPILNTATKSNNDTGANHAEALDGGPRLPALQARQHSGTTASASQKTLPAWPHPPEKRKPSQHSCPPLFGVAPKKNSEDLSLTPAWRIARSWGLGVCRHMGRLQVDSDHALSVAQDVKDILHYRLGIERELGEYLNCPSSLLDSFGRCADRLWRL